MNQNVKTRHKNQIERQTQRKTKHSEIILAVYISFITLEITKLSTKVIKKDSNLTLGFKP
jgi:hypothetical protein